MLIKNRLSKKTASLFMLGSTLAACTGQNDSSSSENVVTSTSAVAISSLSSAIASSLSSVHRSSSSSSQLNSSSSSAVASGELIIQELTQGACQISGIENDIDNSGFTGTGYINTPNAIGETISWHLNAATSEPVTLKLRFANGSSQSRTGELKINNGSNGNYTIDFANTGAWNQWQETSITIDLVQGENIITLTSKTLDGLANIDYLAIVGAGVAAGTCTETSSSASATSSLNATSSVSATSSSGSNSSLTIDSSKVVGWAAMPECGVNGTTGGGDASPITVTTTEELKAAMNSSDTKVIYVSGRIKTPGNFSGRKNKTLIGINNAEIYGGTGLVVATNIIVRNIKFTDGANDSFGLSGSKCIWLDHIESSDGADGNLDIVNGTDLVTVSWSKFYYTKGHSHMLSNLVGNSQPLEADIGKERVTFHHNWWGAGVNSRKPRVRYGHVHVFNNYYHYTPVSNDAGDNYDVGAGYMSKLLVENNYFDGSNKPITWMSDEGTAEVVERGNEYVNAGAAVSRGDSFTPPYAYKHILEPANLIKASVTARAGVQVDLEP